MGHSPGSDVTPLPGRGRSGAGSGAPGGSRLGSVRHSSAPPRAAPRRGGAVRDALRSWGWNRDRNRESVLCRAGERYGLCSGCGRRGERSGAGIAAGGGRGRSCGVTGGTERVAVRRGAVLRAVPAGPRPGGEEGLEPSHTEP